MKTFIAVIVYAFFSFTCSAQQYYFAYLQTDSKQPFYVKVNDQIYSSSATGYVVIPKLLNGDYIFSIGFPKAEWPQQHLNVVINDKDEGYLLKDFKEKGWGLFNLQTMAVTMARDNNLASSGTPAASGNSGGFTSVLSGVINEPGLGDKPAKPATAAAAPIVESEPAQKEKPEVMKPSTVKPKQTINRISAAGDEEGLAMVYVDNSMFAPDTIKVFIPVVATTTKADVKVDVGSTGEFPAPVIKQDTAAVKPVEEIAFTQPKQQAQPEAKPGDPKFIEIELPNPNAGRSPEPETVAEKAEPPLKPAEQTANNAESVIKKKTQETQEVKIFNSDCKSVADENDFIKLRKKMVSGSDDEDMISIARKGYKSRCYTTEQIKNLGALFLTDAGKYQFYDASYAFVYDSSNYRLLEEELKDEYYINRFRAMVTR